MSPSDRPLGSDKSSAAEESAMPEKTSRMSKTKPYLPYPLTDAGNAELIAKLFGETLRYDHHQGRWLIWDKGRCRWEEDKTCAVYNLAVEAARHRLHEAEANTSDHERQEERRWAVKSEDRYRVDAALEMAKSQTPISDDGTGWISSRMRHPAF